MFSDCEVIGTDLCPIQDIWVPPNVKLYVLLHFGLLYIFTDLISISEIEDCTEPWTFASESFDYVHMRLLYGSIANWSDLYDEAYRVTKPGGWIESMEASPMGHSDDGSLGPDTAIGQWGDFYKETGEKTGRTFLVIEQDIQRKECERLGLEDIQVVSYRVCLIVYV